MAMDSSHPFKSLINISQRNPYVAVPPGTSLLHVAHILADNGIHRVAVEQDGKVTKVISQSHILSILATVSLTDAIQRI